MRALTTSKEQCAFIYNIHRIIPLNRGYTAYDPQRRMNRNPFVASFQCVQIDVRRPFSFTLIAVHTDPDVVPVELRALSDILQLVRRSANEDDVIMVGDFNASADKFRELGQIPNLFAAIPPGLATNTNRTACYDNILFDRNATTEFNGQYGVFDVATYYGLTRVQAAQISDHMPVWATFSAFESQDSVAGQNYPLQR